MLADLRLAVRALARVPGLVLVAVLTIALGVAANATAFAWWKSVALDPLPGVRDARELVLVRTLEQRSGARHSIAYPDYRDWRRELRLVDGLAVYAMTRFGVRAAPRDAAAPTTSEWGNYASADYWRVLGAVAQLGRLWRPDEAATPGGAPVVVVSDRFWRARLGADPRAVGRTLWVNGVACTVIGVTPPGFAGAFVGLTFDLWVPVTMYPRLADWRDRLEARHSQWLVGVARPRPGVGLAQLDAELRAVGARVAAASGAVGRVPLAEPFDEGEAQRMVAPLFGVLLAAAALVQLVVCANVANLLLARAALRRRELGVRAALGAGRGRLVRQLSAESLLLAAGGTALGVGAALGAGRLLDAVVPAVDLPVHLDAGVDWRVLALGAALAALTALLAGVLPAWRSTRAVRGDALAASLAQGSRGATRGRRAGRALVVVQLALALVALVAAGLFARTLDALGRIERGFRDPEQVLVAFTDLAQAGRTADTAGQALVERWLDAVRALPGVEAATVSETVPLGLGVSNSNDFHPDGYTPRPTEAMNFLFNAVGPDYFATLRHPIVRGRAFDARDRAGAPAVAIVNETFVRRFLAGREPIGAVARYGRGGDPVTIVGVARDGRYQVGDLTGAPVPFVYVPLAQNPRVELYVQVRARPGADPLALVPGVRRALAALDPALPLVAPTTLERWARAAAFPQRTGASVLAALGALALLLAAVGLYAVTSYTVAGRTREIGVRVALGATAGRVVAGVLGDGGRTVAAGVVLGAAAAVAVARLLRAQLVGVAPLDPLAFGGAIVLLGAAAFVASWLPARRAARIDPVEALRAE